MKHLTLFLIQAYQRVVSPYIPSVCRYDPTCSHYSYQVIQEYGFFKGSRLGLSRLARCHPLGGRGYDPIP